MRCFCRVEYDGSSYAGWQIQSHDASIQSSLEKAFSTVIRVPCKIVGAGRTDAGVHARGQGMHVDLPDSTDLQRCEHSVNAILPHAIAIYNLQVVDQSFHARYSATERWYCYRFVTRKTPLKKGRVLVLPYAVDCQLIQDNLSALHGTHDFSAFCASGSSTENKVCTVTHVSLEEMNDEFIFTIKANRFIYKMVRSIVGTLLDIGRGHITEPLESIISSKDRNRVGETAPSHGLVLEYVTYAEVV